MGRVRESGNHNESVIQSEVGVVVIAYNQEDVIRECLDSIVSQKFFQPLQIVVHDDASTDSTPDVIREYASKYPNIVPVLQTDNQVALGNSPRQIAMSHLDTEYVAFCDGDDYWTDETKIARQYGFMRANPWCSLVFHPAHIIDETAGHPEAEDLRRWESLPWLTPGRLSGDLLSWTNFIVSSAPLTYRSYFDESFWSAVSGARNKDWLAWNWAARYGDLGLIDRKMSIYRLRDAGTWSQLNRLDHLKMGAASFVYLMDFLTDGKESFRHAVASMTRRAFVDLIDSSINKSHEISLSRITSERDQARSERDFLAANLEGVKNSRSWRWTAPLRRRPSHP